MIRFFVLTAGLAFVLVAPLQGQVSVTISPMAGVYLPVSNVLENIRFGGAGGPIIGSVKQEPGFLVGGRLGVRVAMIGVEAEAGYALSKVNIPQGVQDAAGVSDDANVFLGSLNLTWDFFQAPFTPLALYLSAGGGITARSGEFWDRFGDTTSITGVLGLGLRLGLGPLARLRIDFRDYIYNFEPSRGTEQLDGLLQNDLIATIGLDFTFSPTP